MLQAGYAAPEFAGRAQKLAQLIVRECASIINQRKNQAINDGWKVDESMSAAATDIEEHFGVE